MSRVAQSVRARRALDRRTHELQNLRNAAARPAGGWLRATREALSMSIADLAQRLGVSPSTVLRFEQSERAGRIQLDTLTRVAEQLGCDVVYALVPRRPLEAVVDDRARELAVEELHGVGHTMELEAQGLAADRMAERIEELAEELKARPGLWRLDENA
jgi:predicted DNA-binding mobile mystery protein A